MSRTVEKAQEKFGLSRGTDLWLGKRGDLSLNLAMIQFLKGASDYGNESPTAASEENISRRETWLELIYIGYIN